MRLAHRRSLSSHLTWSSQAGSVAALRKLSSLLKNLSSVYLFDTPSWILTKSSTGDVDYHSDLRRPFTEATTCDRPGTKIIHDRRAYFQKRKQVRVSKPRRARLPGVLYKPALSADRVLCTTFRPRELSLHPHSFLRTLTKCDSNY
jgi:hypothetical protein